MPKGTLVPIKELYAGLYDGPHATPKPATSGPIFLGIKNITDDGHFDFSNIRHISDIEYSRWTKRVKPSGGDIVFTYEATLNRYAIIQKDFIGCLGRRMALIRPDERKAHNRYLYYYFFSPEWRGTIQSNKLSGSTVDRIPLTRFPEFPVRLYDINIQKKIAGVLGAYDDLIENNSKRIQNLKSIARLIYRSYLDKYANDLSETTIGDCLLDLESGRRPKGGVGFLKKGIPSIGAENINGLGHHDYSKDKYVSNEFFISMNKGKIKDGDVAIYKDGAYIGRSSYFLNDFPHPVACVNEHVFLLRPNSNIIGSGQLYLIVQTSEVVARIRGTNSNSAQPGINQSGLKGVTISVLPKDVGLEFENKINPIFRLITALSKKNNKLAKARDLLLPRLISGDIDA